jgi:hypothetical protein
MAGDPAAPPMTNKVFGITNIKSHIPLLLDLEKLNYDAWRELFSTHCNAFDVLDHVDDTYDDPKPKPTEPEWHKIDSVVKMWIYGTLSQNLLPQVFLSSSSSVWHQRLGHPGDQVLKSLISNKFISCNKKDTTDICHSCHLGKHIRLPFVSSDSVICNVFYIVHSDAWTSPIASNIRYYVIFLDHFTHYLWVFPLKQKSDVYAKFVQFFTYVKTQFNITIKSFQM